MHENNFDGNNRETITGDGRVHGYMDTVENITPNSFTLKPNVPLQHGADVAKRRRPNRRWQGRRAVSTHPLDQDGRVELVEPWEILPDATSVINISSFRRRFIYTNNRAYDSSVALQLYGSMIEGIIADNETARTGGYNGDAMSGEANWFNQFLRNRITVGNQYRGPRNEVPPTDAQLGCSPTGPGRAITGTRWSVRASCGITGWKAMPS